MIHIIDYGMGNISSIQNMLKKVGAPSVITSNPNEILSAEKIILPGVGSFDTGMKLLNERGWTEVLNKKILEEKIIVLGVCLGVQLMCKGSEEGIEKGLCWLDADVVRFKPENAQEQIRIPHMGWNSVSQEKNSSLLSMNEEHRFYFVHSYHLQNVAVDCVWTKTHYGYDFVSAWNKKDLSYWLALDNKIFSYIMAEIPVLATAQPEYSKAVEGNNCGVCINPETAGAFANGLKEIFSREEEFKSSLKKAKQVLCWEEEQKNLLRLYSELIS